MSGSRLSYPDPDSARPSRVNGSSRRAAPRSRACSTPAECLRARIGPWASATRSGRSRSRASSCLLLLERIRRVVRDRPLHAPGYRCDAAQGARPGAAGRGVGPAGAGGASHDWRGVSDGGGPCRPLAGTGRRIRHRTGGIEMRDTGLPEAPEPRVEPGRPRALQSGRKPQRPGCALRLSGNLHHAAVGECQGATSSAGEGSRRICRRGQQGPSAVSAASGAESVGDLPVAEGPGRCRRDLPPAAVDAQRGPSAFEGRPATGERRGGGSNAGDMAGQPASTAAGVGQDRWQGASGTGPGRAARFPDGSHSRWRTPDRRRDPGVVGRNPMGWRWSAAVGWKWTASGCSRMLEHFREVERTAAENGLGFREAARLLAGADVAAGDASEDAAPSGPRWSPARGSRRR